MIEFRLMSEDDFPLTERFLSDPEMMRHLGGPQSHEQIVATHRRYLGRHRVRGTRPGCSRSAFRMPVPTAVPAGGNGASNAVCQKAGFVNLGECQFEYPKGNLMTCNDWALDPRHTESAGSASRL